MAKLSPSTTSQEILPDGKYKVDSSLFLGLLGSFGGIEFFGPESPIVSAFFLDLIRVLA
jgi:hypothetical protein